MDAQKLLSYS